ncbi:MAG: tetratricopeptide repeat protein [Planctomycetota bacterium]
MTRTNPPRLGRSSKSGGRSSAKAPRRQARPSYRNQGVTRYKPARKNSTFKGIVKNKSSRSKVGRRGVAGGRSPVTGVRKPASPRLGKSANRATNANRRGSVNGLKRVTPRPGRLRSIAPTKTAAPRVAKNPKRLQGRGYLPPAASAGVVVASGHSGSHSSHSSSLGLGFFFGGGSFGFNLSYGSGHHYYDHYNPYAFSYGYGGGPWYTNSYLHSAGYRPYWNRHYYGHRFYRGHRSYFGFRRFSRFHFGFNYYHPYSHYSPYPLYRSSYYEPYYVSSYAAAYPAYRTYHYVRRPAYYASASYGSSYGGCVESVDPYVEEEVAIDISELDDEDYELSIVTTSLELAPSISLGLSEPFIDDFARDLSYDEYLAYGEEALFNGDYLSAAEAFRRAVNAKPQDDYALFQLGTALFGAGRYQLAARMIELGLDQNPAWLHRRFSLEDVFASVTEFKARTQALEGYLIDREGDSEARFLLSYVYYFSGNLFGARSNLRLLKTSGSKIGHVDAMVDEAERRLLQLREQYQK